jgi:hypothetical protein
MEGNLEFSVYTDPTLDAMHKQVEARAAAQPSRPYLGASGIGDKCERKIWYRYTGATAKPMQYSGCYAVEDGHKTEDLIASRLRLVPGLQLWTVDENGRQFGFSDHNKNFRGHIDGVILGLYQAPSTPHIWEHKAVNDKKFAYFEKLRDKHGEKETLRHWDWTYFVQGQIYMHYFDMKRHYITISTPGGRKITSARTEYDGDIAKAHIAKARRIIEAKEPPPRMNENPSWYECKWCPFHGVCHAAAV